jgi:hypothetical protein
MGWEDIPIVNRYVTAQRPEQSSGSVNQFLPAKLEVQAAGEKAREVIWFGRGDICLVLVGGNDTGVFTVGMDAAVQEGQLSGGPPQRMDQQPFSRMEGDELVD